MAILPCASTANQNRLDVALDYLDSVRADITDESQCPAWCIVHSPSDNGFVHYGDVAEVTPTGCGVTGNDPIQVTEVCLQREATGPLDAPFILLAGATDTELTADEALHLAGLLILAARRACTTPAAPDPHVLCTTQHDGECPRRMAGALSWAVSQ